MLLTLMGCPTPDTGDTNDVDTSEGTELPAGCDVVDCENPDCASVFECTWPTAMSHSSDIDFVGNNIQCQTLIGPIPFDVPDCVTDLTAQLTERITGDLCAQCDKTFEGPIAYSADTCSEQADSTPPANGAWGIVFVSETERELWLPDGSGTWIKSSDLVLESGAFTVTSTSDVQDSLDECTGGPYDLGDLTVTASFTDL